MCFCLCVSVCRCIEVKRGNWTRCVCASTVRSYRYMCIPTHTPTQTRGSGTHTSSLSSRAVHDDGGGAAAAAARQSVCRKRAAAPVVVSLRAVRAAAHSFSLLCVAHCVAYTYTVLAIHTPARLIDRFCIPDRVELRV